MPKESPPGAPEAEVTASKNRPQWDDLPEPTRTQIERLVQGQVVRAENCPGGFSPGFASKLMLSDGRYVFVKAVHVDEWPDEGETFRAELKVVAAMPAGVPAPRFFGSYDDGRWLALAFEAIEGREPAQPWNPRSWNGSRLQPGKCQLS